MTWLDQISSVTEVSRDELLRLAPRKFSLAKIILPWVNQYLQLCGKVMK